SKKKLRKVCNVNCILFGIKNLKEEVEGKKIIEVGSYNENGSLREFLNIWKPADYIGIDIVDGPGVDIVCSAENMLDKFNKESFDIVISTEMLEHVRDWRRVISNFKAICKPGGIILITTRSFGFSYHGFPYDFWRYETDDMREIFSDCQILALEKDSNIEGSKSQSPGVFIKVRKPINFIENNLSDYKLYSILVDKRVKNIEISDLNKFLVYFKYKNRINFILNKLNTFMTKILKILKF
ncbi:MAG: methyltransferase domain-containing protein, partial [Candidatus Hodarchaeota archaeon]